MRKQSKKEKEVINKFKIDTKGMSSSQIIEYMKLSGLDQDKFVNNIVKIDNSNKDKNNDNNKLSNSSKLTKKQREKGFRAERIWIKGNDTISHECKCSNDVRNSAQYFERANYFKNRDLLREKKEAGDNDFKRTKKDIDKDGNEIITEIKLNPNIVGGIDLGLRNFATIGFAEIDPLSGSGKLIGQPIMFKGGISKSINQYYNKIRAEIQSIYEHQTKKLKTELRHLKFQYNNIYINMLKMKNSPKDVKDKLYKEIQSVKGELKKIRTGPVITKLAFDRNNKMMDLMHKYSRYIIDECISMRVGTLVIGHNKGQKQSIELGGITNQNFVFIPFYKLIKMIKYKAEEVGIHIIEQEESYTSKCSLLDRENVCKKSDNKYLGKRISRGLFRSFEGIIINADVNGVYNIIRKAFPNIKFLVDGIEGVRLHPVRINPLG